MSERIPSLDLHRLRTPVARQAPSMIEPKATLHSAKHRGLRADPITVGLDRQPLEAVGIEPTPEIGGTQHVNLAGVEEPYEAAASGATDQLRRQAGLVS